MFDSPIIDFCIGMTFFYVILTLICTMINEYFMDKWGSLRQKNLLDGVSGLFYDVQKVTAFYTHPLIRGLYRDQQQPTIPVTTQTKTEEASKEISDRYIKDSMEKCAEPFKGILKNLPSYIPSRTFAIALLDILAPASQANKPQSCQDLRQAILTIDNDRIKMALLPLIDAAQDNVEKARQNIEKWFDDTMDRVSGWFKRKAKQWLFVVAAVVCFALNADSIMVGKILWQNKELRTAFVTQAEKYKPEPSPTKKEKEKQPSGAEQTPPASKDIPKEIKSEIDKLPLPLGWVQPSKEKPSEAGELKDPREVPYKLADVILKIIGLFFTALAVSLGAPFWTDLLNSFVNLRRAGKVPAKAGEEKK